MIGAIISLVLLIRRASRPHVAVLGCIPGTRRFSDHERHPDNELIPGVLIFRPESGLMYFNMDHVRDKIVDRVGAETTTPKLVVLDLSECRGWTCTARRCLGAWRMNSPRLASRCRPWKRAPRCASVCGAKGWRIGLAESTGSPLSRTR